MMKTSARSRRAFLKLAGTGVPALVFSRMPVMAGPFEVKDWSQAVPVDKKLHPEWVKSLYARGKPTVYTKSKNELRHIGMPVGGICTGTLYLSGDGRLWNWDIFNQKTEGVLPTSLRWEDIGMDFGSTNGTVRSRDGARYVKPALFADSQDIAQGFALMVTDAGGAATRPMSAEGWAEVAFTGQYPIGTVDYSDPAVPVAVRLEAFSPFIPQQADDSGLPATVFHFTVTNRSAGPVKACLAGWLQNATAFYSARPGDGTRVNRVRHGGNASLVAMAFEPGMADAATARPDRAVEDSETGYGKSHPVDFGTMALAVMGKGDTSPDVGAGPLPQGVFDPAGAADARGKAPVGGVSQTAEIAPGQSAEFRFVVAWHFPKTSLPCPDAKTGNYYAKRFRDAAAVVDYLAVELPRLESLTRLWRDTWQDSTLPHWFLERTFINTSTLATTTSHRFGSGRFWGWEGVGCCQGTCTHVWHYAQAVARLFPEIERDLRERVDFGIGFDAGHGVVRHRAEGTGPAIDGQCGRILGVWREHQMSTDRAFLQRVWPNVKIAAEHVIRHDSDGDGVIDGPQENTLDAAWFGQIAWITSLAIAALRATGEMAEELGDAEFAARCRAQAEKARAAMESRLYNGEYFYQIPDPARPKTLGTYEACHIDQVQGQSWAWQTGLGRVLDRDRTLSALKALWKYNFTPDVGPFRKQFTSGRAYALAGEGGMIMSSNPRMLKDVYGISSWQIGYFNECMSGFEHQVASHMMAEGMTLEALAVTRAIHDRYHASRRNPFNEIECSDHYARAMASYGTFITACGFTCHGPAGCIGFAPKLNPGDFRAPFTVAGGWGTYAQRRAGRTQTHTLEIRHGRTTLRTLAVEVETGAPVGRVSARLGGRPVDVTFQQNATRIEVVFDTPAVLGPGAGLEVVCGLA